jgi:hypothetical protein
MSSAYLICHGAPVPADRDQVPGLVAELIDAVNAEAARLGWTGTAFDRFSSIDGYLSFDVVPGERPATVGDLRAFREAQRRAQAAARSEPEQRTLL